MRQKINSFKPQRLRPGRDGTDPIRGGWALLQKMRPSRIQPLMRDGRRDQDGRRKRDLESDDDNRYLRRPVTVAVNDTVNTRGALGVRVG